MLRKTKMSFVLVTSLFLAGSVIAKKTPLQEPSVSVSNLTQSIDELSQSYQALNSSLMDVQHLLQQSHPLDHSLGQSLTESASDRIAENLRGSIQREHESVVRQMHDRILSDLAELQKQLDETDRKFNMLAEKVDRSKLKKDEKQSIKQSINVMLHHQIQPIKAQIAALNTTMLQARFEDNPHLKAVSEKLEHIEKQDLPGIWARIATTTKYLMDLEAKARS